MTQEEDFALSELALRRVARESDDTQRSERCLYFGNMIFERALAVYNYIINVHNATGET